MSRNAKQALNNLYSYTLYDALGRITQVGEKQQPQAMTDATVGNNTQLHNWINYQNNTYPHKQVTRTVYDDGKNIIDLEILEPDNRFKPKTYTYRNRVAFTQYFDQLGYSLVGGNYVPVYTNYNYGAFYGYDIHGNVEQFLHHYKTGALNSYNPSHAFKLIHYRYDLISGKVNYVAYQPGQADALYHRYAYDAENRLTEVYSTHRKDFVGDRNVEEKEAVYDYYAHGPLARTELGTNQVQGLDYAYTLQGWLKGVNSTALNPAYDMGVDGSTPSSARDAMAFSLNYFMGDYKAINNPPVSPFGQAGAYIGSNYKPLYNGNISHISNSLSGLTTQLYNYKYDQLNRLKSMDAYSGFNHSNNSWSALTATGLFSESITYDANGNINSYHRDGDKAATPAMDRMTYSYLTGTNQLDHITETVPAANYDNDMETQPSGYYAYDAIGNLIGEGTRSIDWTVYGKIRSITQAGEPTITYTYDAAGNRISKTVGTVVTWYVRDAQGNTLSTYAYDGTHLLEREQYLFGSARIGVFNRNLALSSSLTLTGTTVSGIGSIYSDQAYRGQRQYELSNHLGNVLATISDKKVWNSGNSSFDAHLLSASDYYPFGMQMPGRTVTPGGYRYGFNGQEMSNEIAGTGNSYTAEFWEYDPRIGRRWNLDPKPVTGYSLYSAFGNNPILFNDPLGDTIPTFETFMKGVPKTNFTIKKENRKPLLDVTASLTLGTIGVNTEIGNVGFSFAGQFGERDLVGFRDDKIFVNGKTRGDKEATTRTGFSGALAGFGGAFSFEGKGVGDFSNPNFLEKKEFKTEVSVPFVTFEKTQPAFKKANATEQTKLNLVGFKAGFIVGVELKVDLNVSAGNVNSYYVPYAVPDNTSHTIQVIPVDNKKKK